MRMDDCPRHIYRCADDADIYKSNPSARPPKNDSHTHRLTKLEVGSYYTIPKSSMGVISRVARRTGHKFRNEQRPETKEIRVWRIA